MSDLFQVTDAGMTHGRRLTMNHPLKTLALTLIVGASALLGGCVYEEGGYTRPSYSAGVVVAPDYGYSYGPYYNPWWGWGGSTYLYYDHGWGHRGGWHDGRGRHGGVHRRPPDGHHGHH